MATKSKPNTLYPYRIFFNGGVSRLLCEYTSQDDLWNEILHGDQNEPLEGYDLDQGKLIACRIRKDHISYTDEAQGDGPVDLKKYKASPASRKVSYDGPSLDITKGTTKGRK